MENERKLKNCYCVFCGTKLRPFKAYLRDWDERKLHKVCREKQFKIYEIIEILKRQDEPNYKAIDILNNDLKAKYDFYTGNPL